MRSAVIFMALLNSVLAAFMFSKIGGKGVITIDLEAQRNIYAVIGGFYALTAVTLLACLPSV